MLKLFTISLGLLEIAFMSWVLKCIFVSLMAHEFTMLTSASMILFLLWLGQKLNNMSGVAKDGK